MTFGVLLHQLQMEETFDRLLQSSVCIQNKPHACILCPNCYKYYLIFFRKSIHLLNLNSESFQISCFFRFLAVVEFHVVEFLSEIFKGFSELKRNNFVLKHDFVSNKYTQRYLYRHKCSLSHWLSLHSEPFIAWICDIL